MQKLARFAVEDIEETFAICPEQERPDAAAEFAVDQNGGLHGVPIPFAVRGELKVQLEFTGIGVEGDYGTGEQVIAGADFGVPVRSGIADSPVGEIKNRVVGAGEPDRPAALLPGIAAPRFVARFAGFGDCFKFPEFLAGRGVIGGEETANAEFSAGGADENVVFDDEGA